MKITHKFVLAVALLGAATVSQSAFAHSSHLAAPKVAVARGVSTTNFAVSKMDCEGCSNGLNASLKNMKGVKSARVDFKAKRATVSFDAKQTNNAKLLAFFKTAGFPAKVAK